MCEVKSTISCKNEKPYINIRYTLACIQSKINNEKKELTSPGDRIALLKRSSTSSLK